MALKAPELDKREIPEAPWDQVLDQLGQVWEQGEHVSLLGKTGAGKTTLAFQLLDVRRYVIVLLTKRHDDLIEPLKARGFRIVGPREDRPTVEYAPKVGVHLPAVSVNRYSDARQTAELQDLIDQLWSERGWTIYLDEVATVSDLPGMQGALRRLWKEARSSRLSLVAGTQRPAWVPKDMYDQPRFLFFWRNNNREMQKRIADMHGPDPETVRQIVAQLDRFEVLIVDSLTDQLVRTRPPKLG